MKIASHLSVCGLGFPPFATGPACSCARGGQSHPRSLTENPTHSRPHIFQLPRRGALSGGLLK